MRRMRHGILAMAAAVLIVGASSVATATSLITFDEPGIIPWVTTDPGFTLDPVAFAGTGVGMVVFSAGPGLWEDTVVYDTPGGWGYSLGTGFIGSESVINVDIFGTPITSIITAFDFDSTFDAALVLEGYDSGGTLVASATVAELESDAPWIHTIGLSYSGGMSRLHFYDPDMNLFNIDDFEIEKPAYIPEPATFLLLLSAAPALLLRRRRR